MNFDLLAENIKYKRIKNEIMNTINFNETGGYRLKQNTFKRMQETYFDILNAFISHFKVPAVGNFIIGGCKIDGANITDGYLYIDGDLCPFIQSPGTLASKIKKQINLENLPFKDGTNPQVFRSTFAVSDALGSPLSSFVTIKSSWNDLVDVPIGLIIDPATQPGDVTVLNRISEIEKKLAIFREGGVVFVWRRPLAEIPAGYAEVTELRGRTTVGIDTTIFNGQFVNPEFSILGASGGSKTGVLDIENLPPHDHEVGYQNIDLAGSNDGSLQTIIVSPTSANKEKTTKTGGLQGVAKPFATLNPFRIVNYIEYIG